MPQAGSCVAGGLEFGAGSILGSVLIHAFIPVDRPGSSTLFGSAVRFQHVHLQSSHGGGASRRIPQLRQPFTTCHPPSAARLARCLLGGAGSLPQGVAHSVCRRRAGCLPGAVASQHAHQPAPFGGPVCSCPGSLPATMPRPVVPQCSPAVRPASLSAIAPFFFFSFFLSFFFFWWKKAYMSIDANHVSNPKDR